MGKTDNTYCVYMHINKINNKVYIGQTCQNTDRRWRDGNGYKDCPYFYNAIQKYGWDNFEHIIWANKLTIEEANKMEELLIALYNTTNSKYGYNIKCGGNNHTFSEEVKQKMSKNHADFSGENHPLYGKHHSDETRRKMSEVKKERYKGKNHPMYRKHHSNVTKQKIGEAHRGKIISDETKKKMSESHKGEKHHMYGKHHSEETKRKIKENHADMSGANSPSAKKVVCIETGEIYQTMIDASIKTQIYKSGISKCCRGVQKTAGGFHWRYFNKGDNLCL